MSRDSSATYVHTHASRLADVFEEFCRPPSSTIFAPGSTASNTTTQQQQQSATTGNTTNGNNTQGTLPDGSGMTALPGHYLPFEEINLPAHLMPINPEDEDDVVPDMHAAFGIDRALGQGGQAGGQSGGGEPGGEASHAGVTRESVWRDLGMEGLIGDGVARRDREAGGGARREGKRTGLLLMR
jgi:hypothetical protein